MPSLLKLTGAALAAALLQPACAAVYVAAHPDDVVLLMGRQIQHDVRTGKPTVIVILTAGDAGNGSAAVTEPGWRSHQYNQIGNAYFRVRHNAHEAALKTWLAPDQPRVTWRTRAHVGANATEVETVQLGNVALILLNLPDMRLGQLLEDSQLALTDVTGVNHYTAAQLRQNLRTIIARHQVGSLPLLVHLPEPDPAFRAPGYNDTGVASVHTDHPDHTAAGRLVSAALEEEADFPCVARQIYMGYAIRALPDSMSLAEKLSQITAFQALDRVLRDQGNISWRDQRQHDRLGSMDAFHTSFYGKQRWRAVPDPRQACRPGNAGVSRPGLQR